MTEGIGPATSGNRFYTVLNPTECNVLENEGEIKNREPLGSFYFFIRRLEDEKKIIYFRISD